MRNKVQIDGLGVIVELHQRGVISGVRVVTETVRSSFASKTNKVDTDDLPETRKTRYFSVQ